MIEIFNLSQKGAEFLYIILGVAPEMCYYASVIASDVTFTQDKLITEESNLYYFRDNYLTKSTQGNEYIAAYYLLSKYGIENNLVNKYYKEHYELLQNSIEIAYDLQYGRNANQVLINKQTSEKLKDMLKVYRKSLNHREIEPLLNYLEADLEKYYNKPKYEIAADFKQN